MVNRTQKRRRFMAIALGILGILTLLAAVPIGASAAWVVMAGMGSIADVLIIVVLAGVAASLGAAEILTSVLLHPAED